MMDATLAIVKALKQNDTRSGIQQALISQGFEVKGAIGTVRFATWGERDTRGSSGYSAGSAR